MKKSDDLKQKRAAKIKTVEDLIQARATEKRDFSEAEETNFDSLEKEIRALGTQIDREIAVEAAQARTAINAGSSGIPNIDGEEIEIKKIGKRVSLHTAIKRSMSGMALEGLEKEMNDIGLQQNARAGVTTPDNAKLQIPYDYMRATAQTVTEDSAGYGGALVSDQAPRAQMGFSPNGILDELGVTYWPGLSGGNIPLPVINDYTFSWLTETGAITPQKGAIAGPTLNPTRLGGAVQLSNRLLAQDSTGVEARVRQKLAQGFENLINAAAINGSGSAQPEGVLNKTGIGVGASVDADVPTKALVMELVKLVNEANSTGDSLAFLGSPAMRYLLEITEYSTGSGLFLKNDAAMLQGFKDLYSTHVPQLSGNEVLIFGNWSEMYVGTWGSMSVLSDPFSASLNDSVQLVLNGNADVQIAQPGAFAANKFFNEVGV
tara:strand:+ start:6136 stop:7434 length:1299 start_codon:yes stop_codon:yes gene_type:complete